MIDGKVLAEIHEMGYSADAMSYATVAIAAPTAGGFTYEVPATMIGRIAPGQRVAVPFRRRTVVGYVLDVTQDQPSSLVGKDIRAINEILDEDAVFSSTFLSWLRWLSQYYCASIGEVCRTALPARLNRLHPPKTLRPTLPHEMEHREKEREVVLTPDQEDALDRIRYEASSHQLKPILLHGITGSGKTEIYLRLFEALHHEGRQGILLVPEIGLTPQLSARVVSRFGDSVALYHSGLTDAQRHHQWERMKKGEVSVVVGTRSALFAPLPRLGAIVVDEEHDPSYKQDEGVLYNARDAAVMRGRMEGAVVVLGSATPSVESFANARTNKYHYIHLPERTGGGAIPVIEIIDMRKHIAGRIKGHERCSLSAPMIQAISDTLKRGEQCMIFLNRRGFAHFLICEECGHSFECPNCDISLAYHRRPPKLSCHYCDYTVLPPAQCPACMGIALAPMGRGTERIELELAELFPRATIARLDRDSVTQSASRTSIFRGMRDGSIDILVGTQMIAKGHDFPGVTLVGIVSADVALHLPDFRSAERTFQLTTQVAGRAGRGSAGARVLLQTFQPDHPSLTHAKAHDYGAFFEEERRHRESLGYPPFVRLTNIRLSATDARKLDREAHKLADALRFARKTLGYEKLIALLGPAPAPMEKVRNRFRWQLLIKAPAPHQMTTFLTSVRSTFKEFQNKGLRIAIDVDPLNML